jgi:hypothetical protein
MGKLPGKMDFPIQFENYLPVIETPYKAQNDHEVIVMDLLETGRSAESVHDSRHSPVGSYLVKSMGIQASLQLLEQGGGGQDASVGNLPGLEHGNLPFWHERQQCVQPGGRVLLKQGRQLLPQQGEAGS